MNRATFTPKPSWWLPCTSARSSFTWNEWFCAMPRVAVAAAMLKPPVTTTIIWCGT